MDDLISRQALKQAMYHEAFEADTEMQKWDGGCWIRYKLFEKIVDILPSVQPEQKIVNGFTENSIFLTVRFADMMLCLTWSRLIARTAVQKWRSKKRRETVH